MRPVSARSRPAVSRDREPALTATPLHAYMRDVGRGRVLTADEEVAIATQIAQLRVRAWRALLSHPPFCGAVGAAALAVLGDELDATLVDAMSAAARAFRDRETRVNRESFERAREAAAQAIAEVDLDALAMDPVVADLEMIGVGERDGIQLAVVRPPKGSRPFAAYLERVRGSVHALRMAKHRFVQANLRLVISIANRFDYGLMPLPDLIQEGNIGLMKAVDRFDPRRGFRFSTYASWWIRHSINRALANRGRTVRLPAHVSADQQRIARVRREFEATHGRLPVLKELVEASGLTEQRIRSLKRYPLEPTLSLDLPVGDDDGRTLLDLVADAADSPLEEVEREHMAELLHDCLAQLTPIELDILAHRFGLDGRDESVTLRELGERHALSRERIRQLQERALEKLRREFERHQLLPSG